MSWEVFYFVCFLLGFMLSLLTFLAGSTHFHVPKGVHFHGGAHGAHGSAAGHSHGPAKTGAGAWFNFGTITAFLAWFGGTGFLLTRYSSIVALLGLVLSTVSGIAGASVVFWFVFKFLLSHEQDLDPADYEMVGVLGRVHSPVREGGTGEMLFSRDGARRCIGVRSDDGRPIPRNTEVVVIRFEKGIAYVRPWEELNQVSAPDPTASNEGARKIQGPEMLN
jgi:membrane protein implicated in regulation of membrane protease activity